MEGHLAGCCWHAACFPLRRDSYKAESVSPSLWLRLYALDVETRAVNRPGGEDLIKELENSKGAKGTLGGPFESTDS